MTVRDPGGWASDGRTSEVNSQAVPGGLASETGGRSPDETN